MKDLIKYKRRLFEKYNQNKSETNREEYKRKKQEVKRRVRETKSMPDERLGQRVSENVFCFFLFKKIYTRIT